MSDKRSQSLVSAHSLTIFGDCERLYEFTYINPRPWPAPAHADPARAERAETAGKRFHNLVHMHARGLDPAGLAALDSKLARWYARYLTSGYSVTGEGVYSEQVLAFPMSHRNVYVRYDRLIKQGDRWLIIDWKTSARAPETWQLEEQWQAHLYPFALVEAGAILNNGKPIRPADVEMCFYYLEPDVERRFSYGEDLHRENHKAVEQAIARITAAETSVFPPTGKVSGRCTKPPCQFYSLCHGQAMPTSALQVANNQEESVAAPLGLSMGFEFDDDPVVF